MTYREFLSDRWGKILVQLVFWAAAAAFLLGTGTSAGIVKLLFIFGFLLFLGIHLADFFRLRARLLELESIMSGLDQKYLFMECAPLPRDIYGRRLFHLMHRAGRAMLRAVSDAQASRQEYREYIESWVHEVKTPITAAQLICGNVQGETRRKLLHELAQIDAHVQRVLFYARAENPEKDFIVRQADLAEIVSQAIQNHRTLLIQGGMRLETQGLEHTVYTDGKWAGFILGQLLQNAARYRGETPVVTLSAVSSQKHVTLIIHDNGIGIPSHELPRIFDRGFTGSNGRSRGGSTGMGLYLCRKLADALEIGLRVESEECQGTSVFLSFPSRELS